MCLGVPEGQWAWSRPGPILRGFRKGLGGLLRFVAAQCDRNRGRMPCSARRVEAEFDPCRFPGMHRCRGRQQFNLAGMFWPQTAQGRPPVGASPRHLESPVKMKALAILVHESGDSIGARATLASVTDSVERRRVWGVESDKRGESCCPLLLPAPNEADVEGLVTRCWPRKAALMDEAGPAWRTWSTPVRRAQV